MIDFELPDELAALRDEVAAFVRDKVVPYEADPRRGPHGPSDELRRELQAMAAEAGLLAPHVDREFGGRGLGHVERAVVFEESGYSPLGSLAINVSAPDEGNMHMLERVANDEQKATWLKPLAAGEIRSAFAMSEPPPGAGSDPSALQTSAERDGDHFVVNGMKKWITGADGASLCIVMARTGDDERGRPEATMFLSPMDAPGISHEGNIETIDSGFPGGHALLRFDDLRVHESQVLGEVGQGFRYAQVRLAPARLTHCMRFLGNARRAHDEATAYSRTRLAFGSRLGDHEGVGFMLADNEMDMRLCRLVIWETAWQLDRGELGNVESSQAKVICSERVWAVLDRCVQILGGSGVSGETVVEEMFRNARPFRIYDGPNEVHRWSLARKIVGRP